MGAVILSSGTKGKRYSLPNSEIMIHQPIGGARGQASDIAITTAQILKTKEKINRILAKNTNQSIEKVRIDTDRDFYLSSEDSLSYGIIDKIFYDRKG